MPNTNIITLSDRTKTSRGKVKRMIHCGLITGEFTSQNSFEITSVMEREIYYIHQPFCAKCDSTTNLSKTNIIPRSIIKKLPLSLRNLEHNLVSLCDYCLDFFRKKFKIRNKLVLNSYCEQFQNFLEMDIEKDIVNIMKPNILNSCSKTIELSNGEKISKEKLKLLIEAELISGNFTKPNHFEITNYNLDRDVYYIRQPYCAKCDKTTNLSKHHIIPKGILKKLPSKLKQINYNLVTLCKVCHDKYHNQKDKNLENKFSFNGWIRHFQKFLEG